MADPDEIAPHRLTEVMDSPGNWLALYCERCGHFPFIDMPVMVERFGPSITVRDLVRRGRCSKCGGRDVAVRRGHDGRLARARQSEEGGRAGAGSGG